MFCFAFASNLSPALFLRIVALAAALVIKMICIDLCIFVPFAYTCPKDEQPTETK